MNTNPIGLHFKFSSVRIICCTYLVKIPFPTVEYEYNRQFRFYYLNFKDRSGILLRMFLNFTIGNFI
jgi:hypothetical protein